jgi:subtilisin family serine protease
MKIRMNGRLAAAGIACATAIVVATPASAQAIPNSYICVFKKGAVAKADVPGAAKRAAQAQGGQVGRTYTNTIRGFSANISAQGVAALKRANANIAYCEQDQVAHANPKPDKPGSGGGGGSQPQEQVPTGITRVGGGTTASSATAWVIDSGIDLDHPDLNVDVNRSRTFLGGRTTPDDQNGHGTHVAGTIAAKKNGIGVVGVAPGTTVVSVRVLDRRGSGSFSGVIDGIDYVGGAGQSGDVANMSLGGGFSQALNDAVVAASSKVKFALAAGNESTDAATKSPASANGPNIYTVSAVDHNDRWASFSNYGNPPVDYAEPGVSILSTYKDGGYATLSGTSMATPHLAGILLLGGVRSDGTAIGDPKDYADPIGAVQ